MARINTSRAQTKSQRQAKARTKAAKTATAQARVNAARTAANKIHRPGKAAPAARAAAPRAKPKLNVSAIRAGKTLQARRRRQAGAIERKSRGDK